MTGKLWQEKIHPEDRDALSKHWLANVGSIEPWTAEYRFLKPDGTVTWVMGHTNPQVDGDGQVIGHVGTVDDITDRKRMEQQLHQSHRELEIQVKERTRELIESETRLRQSAALTQVGYWVWDEIEDKGISCSEECARMQGVSVEEWLSFKTSKEQDAKWIHPDDRERFSKNNLEFLESKKPFEMEYRLVTLQGEIRHVREFTEPEFDDNDVLVRSIGSIQDITEQKYAEEALQQSHDQFKQAEQLGNMGHWEWDSINEKMISCSEQLGKFYGMSVDDTLRYFSSLKNDSEVIHPDDRERYLLNTNVIVDGTSRIDIEYRIITPSGEQRHVRENSKVILDDKGKIIKSFGILQDITERKQAEEKLSYQASHDALTGLINRREFGRRAERLISTTERGKGEHAMCFMDLDQFKVVNDTCGHTAGDELLRQLAEVLQIAVRRRDTLARLGGDEFGVLMEHCSLDQAQRATDALLKKVDDFQFSWEGQSFRIGVSIGLVAITETTGNLTELLKQADAACYMAKDLGRNRIHVYRPEDTELAQRHGEMQWVARINQALEDNRFTLYAQSIVPLGNSIDKHYELLLRMIDEGGEIIPPGAYLPAAERYDLIEKLDTWVIGNAFALMTSHPVFVEQIQFVSINLSGQSITNDKFLDSVLAQIKEFDIDADKICFEVTETAAISNLSAAVSFISSLKEIGCHFALDDFGSGLSSFGYLKSLPVDYLKIDGMFVKNMVVDPIDHAMVKSINDIGHVMGMKTIAEFVENGVIKDKLIEIGVDYAQGYWIGKPQPFIELLELSNSYNIENRFI